MVTQASLTAALEKVAGPANVTIDTRAFAVDGVEPCAAVYPEDEAQVAEMVRYANESGLAMIPWGGGRSMVTGNVPAQYDIALSLSRMTRITEHEPADLTATCQAGITVHDLQGALRKHGQAAPFEAALSRQSTVGGALASNAFGASRQAFGTPRDFTIGMRVVTGDGLIVKAGGKVVKNVAGYDICKLFIGSRGTLGVIVEATFKLMPFEPISDSVTWVRSFEGACNAALELQRRGRIGAAVAANANGASSVYPDAPGAAALYTDFGRMRNSEMETSTDDVSVAGPAVDQPQLLRAALTSMPEPLQVRASLLPTAVPSFVSDAERIVPGVRAFAQPVTGDVILGFPAVDEGLSAMSALRDAVARIGGTLVVENCPAEAKQGLDVFGGPPAAFPLMRAIKEQYDPQHVLSPGRFMGAM